MKLTSTWATPALAVLGLGITAALATGCGSTPTTTPQSGTASTRSTASAATTPGTGTTPDSVSSTPGTGRSPTTEAAAGTPRCHTRDVSGSFAYMFGSGAAGSASYTVKLTNKTAHSCTIHGYPGLLLLDAHHEPVPTKAIWDPQAVTPVITLSPGASASARARVWHNATVGDNTAASTAQPFQGCQPTSVYIEITPPDETTHLVVPVVPETQVCGRGTIHLSAFAAGSPDANGS
jgi:hypothetical protein